MSYLGNPPWKRPPGGEFGGKRGRPPDFLNPKFISNLVSCKLDTLGNVISGGEICQDFKSKLKKIEGYTEKFYKEVLEMLKKRLVHLKKKGVTPKDNIKAKSIIRSFTHYNNTNKPGTKLLDLCYSTKTKVLVEKWNKLQIEDLCPINLSLIASALTWVVRVPPRAAQYRTEAILGSIRTEK